MTSSARAEFVNDMTLAVDWSPFEESLEQNLATGRADVQVARGTEEEIEQELVLLETVTDIAILNVLKGLLQFPSADSQAKASKIADNIVYFCVKTPASTEEGDRNAEWAAGKAWSVLFEMVQYIPADHVWQDVLVSAVTLLRQRNDPVTVYGEEVDGKVFWGGLEGFHITRDTIFQGGPPKRHLKGTEEERKTLSYSRWKNLNSFGARLNALAIDDIEAASPPLTALMFALESNPVDEKEADCLVWVACEWLIRSSPQVVQYVNEPIIPPGPRYLKERPGGPPVGVERWGFWKEQLLEFADPEKARFNLGHTTQQKIADALKSMEAAEGTATTTTDGASRDVTMGDLKETTDVVEGTTDDIKDTTDNVEGTTESVSKD